MSLQVKSNVHVIAYTAVVVLLSVAVPSILIWHFMPPFLPLIVQAPFYFTAVLIPLLIAVPLAAFGLHTLKILNTTVDTLDNFIKFDPLTGLLSRTYFLSSVERTRAAGGQFLMIDADHFKRINDAFGHDGGDEALKVIARHTIACASTGFAGRLGGEEFAIYLPRANPEQARLTAASLSTALRQHDLILADRPVRITASIGIAADRPDSPLAHAMKKADIALYAAKSSGRDRFVYSGDEVTLNVVAA